MTTTYTHSVSDGSATLADVLRIGIFDYQRHFGREPRLILVPWWRGSEDKDLVELTVNNKRARFRGIPIRFSIICDAIELSNGD